MGETVLAQGTDIALRLGDDPLNIRLTGQTHRRSSGFSLRALISAGLAN
jgi:hypothetical protein